MERTDVAQSPLLKQVIERDYTHGMNLDNGAEKPPEQAAVQSDQPKQGPDAEPKYNIPKGDIQDNTKEFSFNDTSEAPGDISGDDHTGALNISAASAASFANFAGSAIQMYLPKFAYAYCKVDMENVEVNVQTGKLTINWIGVFEKINGNTEEALKISDDAIKMWKKAFKDYLESENMSFANPKNAFLLASVILIGDMTVKAIQIRKANEEYMRQALEQSNPAAFHKETISNQPNETSDGKADKKAA